MLNIHPAVQAALHDHRPVVALESTIISHGMPYPQNVETALRVEETVREAGATPATIAILDGHLCAGLTADQIDSLGKKGTQVTKVSRRDLPVITARRQDGATTVAATMIIARMAGIPIFATGGIGGVHRGVEHTLDISADLQELARTNVAVVCAGAKSILDLPRSLEYLETMGVPVLGYGTHEFPAFYTRSSGLLVDYRVDRSDEVARILHDKWTMGLAGGVIIANPVPQTYAMDEARMEQVIGQAVQEAEAQQISGKALTPFLLARIEALTGGDSLEANIQLVRHNAHVAAEISVAFAAYDREPEKK